MRTDLFFALASNTFELDYDDDVMMVGREEELEGMMASSRSSS